MKVLDLFSGIGGFSLAAHWMGWETAAFVERDKFCQRVLRKNFGEGIEIHDDITTFDGRPFRGTVDIVTGGFPCQPFSAAGKRKGRDDERHLFPQMLRVIREVGPLWVVAENVRGLLSIESGSVFAEVVASLEGEGYEVVTFCVPASALEAPHRRDRLWIVAADRLGPGLERETASIERRSEHLKHNRDGVRSRPESGNRISNAPNTDDRERSGAVIECEPAHAGAGGDRGIATDGTNAGIARRLGVETDDAGPDRCGYDLGRGRKRIDGRGNAADTSDTRLQRHIGESDASGHAGLSDRTRGDEGAGWREHWYEAAARFCRVDDGVSDRVQRLKALGNSIVPQIAFEIFRAIEAAEAER